MKKILIGFFLFICVVACFNKSNKMSINTAIKADIDSVNPYKIRSSETKQIMYNIYEGLLMPDTKGKVKLALAKSFELSNDNKKYIFEIRDDVYFHSGDKLSIDDVIFSLNEIKRLNIEKAFDNIDKIYKMDNKVLIELKEIDSSFIYALTRPIVLKKTYNTLDKKANGTGPYYISQYIRDNKLVFTKNKNYYGKKANIETINMDILSEENTSILNYISGKYNFLFQFSTNRIKDIKDKKVISYPENMFFIMGINNKRFDKNIRKKIVSAIDNKDIISKATLNFADELKTKKIKLDKDALKGQTFSIKIPSNYNIYISSAQIIKEQLESYGAKVNIVPQEFATWLKKVYSDKDYDLTIIGLSGKLDKNESYQRFVSDYNKNFLNFKNEEYDKLIKKAKITTDIEKRDKIYEKAYDILISDYAAAFIMDPKIAVTMDNNISGFIEYTIPYINFSSLKFGE